MVNLLETTFSLDNNGIYNNGHTMVLGYFLPKRKWGG